MYKKAINNPITFPLFLTIISVLIYLPVLSFGLSGSDDITLFSLLKKNIDTGSSISGLFAKPYLFEDGLFYRPLVSASFWIFMHFSSSLAVHFAVNILIHATNMLILFYLLQIFNADKVSAFLISSLLALSPVMVNSVAWLPGRNDSLCALLVLSSFYFLLKYFSTGKNYFALLNVFLLLAALFVKESAVLAVPVFIIYIFFAGNKLFTPKNFKLFAGWAAAAIIWFIARHAAVKDSAELGLTDNLPFLIQAAGKILLPADLSVLPVIQDTSFIYGILGIVFYILIYFYTPVKNRRMFLFGFGFFLLFMVPSLINVNPEFTANLMLESRLYLPAVGVFISVSQTEFFSAKFKNRNYTFAFIAITLIFYIYSTVNYSQNYSGQYRYWNNAVERSPSLDLGYSGLGLYNMQNNNFEFAAVCYKKAVELNPARGEYYRNAGYCFMNSGNTPAAEDYFSGYLKFFPGDHDINLVLGILKYKAGKYPESEKYLLKASETDKNDHQPLLYLLKLNYESGNIPEARKFADELKKRKINIPGNIDSALYR